MPDPLVNRTALEITNFLLNRLNGAGMPQEWDEFTSAPISDPRLDKIRLRCAQLENEPAEVRIAEFRNALRVLQHLQHVHHV